MKNTSTYILIALIIGTSVALWRSAHKVTPAPSFETITIGTNAEFQPFSFKEKD